MSDYVGGASNCVGATSRTMPADSLLTLYSVSLFSLPHALSRQSPRKKRILKLVFLASARHAPAVAGAPARFGEAFPSTWKQSASVRSSKAQHAWELLFFFFFPAKLKILQRASAQRAVEAHGTILCRCIPGGYYKK